MPLNYNVVKFPTSTPPPPPAHPCRNGPTVGCIPAATQLGGESGDSCNGGEGSVTQKEAAILHQTCHGHGEGLLQYIQREGRFLRNSCSDEDILRCHFAAVSPCSPCRLLSWCVLCPGMTMASAPLALCGSTSLPSSHRSQQLQYM